MKDTLVKMRKSHSKGDVTFGTILQHKYWKYKICIDCKDMEGYGINKTERQMFRIKLKLKT